MGYAFGSIDEFGEDYVERDANMVDPADIERRAAFGRS